MEPRNGTCDLLSRSSSEIRPPSTMMPPSSTMTLVEIVRLLVMRSTATCALAAMLEASCEILSSTESPSLICGVILRMLPTSSRLIVWNGFTCPPAPEMPWFVYWPVTNGTSCAILISASSLSSVTIDGVAMMFVLPMPFSARISAAQLVPFSVSWPSPSVRPLGRLVTLSGSRTPCRIWPRPVPSIGWTKPPAGSWLPSASRSRMAQLTPRSMALSADISTRIASTSTWARRMSRRSTMDITERMTFGGAVTTSALVCGSAQMVTPLSPPAPAIAGAAPAAPPGAAAAVMPWICSRSFCEIFSASA